MNRSNTWTPAQLQILIEQYPYAKNTRILAKKLGKTYHALRSKATVLKLRRLVPNSGYSDATKKELNYIKENYLKIPLKIIASDLGRSYTFVKGRMDDMGLIRPPELIQNIKEATYIKKGNIPKNKGLRQIDYMSRASITRTKKTRFKKGHLPHNTIPGIGMIRIRTDKRTGIKYKYIKLGLAKWRELHRHNYEKKHGKIPKGMCVVFKNGDHTNCNVKNLELITRLENMKRNTIHRFPAVIKSTIRTLSKLNKIIHEKQNKRSA